MNKNEKINIADTNMAFFGTELELNIKLAAAKTEKAWEAAGKVPGLEIWRIEKFNVVSWPKDQYGHFYSGDSYIVLSTYNKKGSDKLFWNAHMWVGTFTTQDEAGTAAYKVVELDDILGRAAVLYRDVQGNESELFLSYFPFINIMEGGIETGFKNVPVDKYRPRLLRVKGRKNFRVFEVELSYRSLCNHDIFILDNGLKIYNWVGSKCNPFEKFKASGICTSIRDERQGKPKIITLEEDTKEEEFWNLLGGKGEINSSLPVEEKIFEKVLYQLTDGSGKLDFKEIARGVNVKKEMLNPDDVFIFDIGYEMYIWIGSKSSSAEKKNSLSHRQKAIRMLTEKLEAL